MTTFERIKKLAKKQGKSLNKVEEELGYGKNVLYRLKDSNPSTERLEEIADYFHVSVDYLLGRTENKNLPQSPKWATEEDIMDLEEMLNSNVNMAYGGEELTEEEKQRLKDVLTGIFWDKLQKKKGL
ncbi:helix-turn-helix transcriptional regulator [Vagococcus carniphilus]|uniref:helix-turn-helix domain-containing protein n=1 Tax=Vagococcus carniphilus TaxID=218144 RepID=UPI0028927408|nr:helix-turn-helix transcriptional regulator [Vagococcus carniphilus]MDT2814325.1 helix-turn-helix transcriptional regulator [Vagococcus carniphilus]